MNRKSSFARLLLFIILGLLIGGILGESLGLLFGELGELMNAGGYDNIVRNFFVAPLNLNFGIGHNVDPVFIDLYMVKFSFGFGLKLNVVSIIGMIVSLYIMKWSGER
ncbi:MAG: DUF4321 domain-containing protein [Fibrobacter sp.]|jgi:hypothetical protein|nr:DUF4321 domain-containing protein [Fibrobacter sp.]